MLIDELMSKGYKVHTMDHRSQGRSGRPASSSKSPHMSHVTSFDQYVDDFVNFASSITPLPGKKLSIICHSMGGLITLKALQRPGLSSLVSCACVSAPMLRFKTPPWPWSVAGFLTGCFVKLGLGSSYAVGKPEEGWEPSKCAVPYLTSHDDPRLSVWVRQMQEEPLLKLGGPSNAWVLACHNACSDFVRDHVLLPEEVWTTSTSYPVPVLLMSSGIDRFVEEGLQDVFKERYDSNVRHIKFPDAYHELLFECDDVRERCYNECAEFIDVHSSEGGVQQVNKLHCSSASLQRQRLYETIVVRNLDLQLQKKKDERLAVLARRRTRNIAVKIVLGTATAAAVAMAIFGKEKDKNTIRGFFGRK